MNAVKICCWPHGTRLSEIAKSLKLSLQALEAKTLLDIKISEEIAGATEWRKWIDENVEMPSVPFCSIRMPVWTWGGVCDSASSAAFTRTSDSWPALKTSTYRSRRQRSNRIKPTSADEPGLRKFIDELFVTGKFTRRDTNQRRSRASSEYLLLPTRAESRE